jgi:hypothetical protein
MTRVTDTGMSGILGSPAIVSVPESPKYLRRFSESLLRSRPGSRIQTNMTGDPRQWRDTAPRQVGGWPKALHLLVSWRGQFLPWGPGARGASGPVWSQLNVGTGPVPTLSWGHTGPRSPPGTRGRPDLKKHSQIRDNCPYPFSGMSGYDPGHGYRDVRDTRVPSNCPCPGVAKVLAVVFRILVAESSRITHPNKHNRRSQTMAGHCPSTSRWLAEGPPPSCELAGAVPAVGPGCPGSFGGWFGPN